MPQNDQPFLPAVHPRGQSSMCGEESMDVDPNYDPSDFLLQELPQQRAGEVVAVHDDLEVSESEDEGVGGTATSAPAESKKDVDEDDDGGGLWF